MKTMVVSEFKTKCIAVLREAQRTGEAVLITRRGRPMARVEPLGEGAAERRLGVHRGRMLVQDGVDLVHAGSEEDWEMLR
ncbi:MAG TPA: type II toxin-antitoxin system prevent-host-death family antitoxin [Gemmatimonadota bacterium]|nr:type II toxin-antitoxin system prevent-host-death family antitoxin [Gemmatimonadota bacterium]